MKGKARPGDKENPIIAEDGYEEERKSNNAQKEAESNLLDELDKVTKNISTISFDSLGSPITSDKGKIKPVPNKTFQTLMKDHQLPLIKKFSQLLSTKELMKLIKMKSATCSLKKLWKISATIP